MFKVNNKIKYFIGLLTLGSLLYVALFGLINMGMNMSHEKGMTSGMSPCPYMTGGSSLCTMNLFDHISAWLNAIRALSIKNILSLILFSVVFVAFAFSNIKGIRWLKRSTLKKKNLI